MTEPADTLRRRLGLLSEPTCGPPERLTRANTWRISRRADCRQALLLDAVQSVEVSERLQLIESRLALRLPNFSAVMKGVTTARLEPYHTAARSFLRKVISHDPLREAWLRQQCRDALELACTGSSIDLVSICNSLPARVATGFLGLSVDKLADIADAMVRLMTDWQTAAWSRRKLEALEAQSIVLLEAIGREAEAARQKGRGPFHEATQLGTQEFEFTEEQILAHLLFLILANVETTSSLLAHILLVFYFAPEVKQHARQSESERRRTVEEVLRYLPPLRRLPARRTADDITVGDRQIPAGSMLAIDIEAANYDPEVFSMPLQFDPSRQGVPTMSFGFGGNACIGAGLARSLAMAFAHELQSYTVTLDDDGPPQWVERDTARRIIPVLHGSISRL